MLIGYARVSTDEQNLDLQFDALKRAGCDEILSDRGFSGALIHRPALDQALKALMPGDVLVTWKLDRLGRSLSHLLSLVSDLEKKGIGFRSLTDAIDTSTAGGRLQFHVMGALAEFERTLISERTKAGMAAARARGTSIGRPAKLRYMDLTDAILTLKNAPLVEIARTLEVSPGTLRRAVAARRKISC
jgi:DNA invertase Pin-like site-specific DNA recombinase